MSSPSPSFLQSKLPQVQPRQFNLDQKSGKSDIVFSLRSTIAQQSNGQNQFSDKQRIHELQLQLQQLSQKNKILQKEKQLLNKRNTKYLQQNEQLTIRITLIKQQNSKKYGDETARNSLLGQINILKIQTQFIKEQNQKFKQTIYFLQQNNKRLMNEYKLLQNKYGDTLTQLNVLFQQRYGFQQRQNQINKHLMLNSRQISQLQSHLNHQRQQLNKTRKIIQEQVKVIQQYQQKLSLAIQNQNKTRQTNINYVKCLQNKCKQMVQQNERIINQYNILQNKIKINQQTYNNQISALKQKQNKIKQQIQSLKSQNLMTIKGMNQKYQHLKLNKQTIQIAVKTIQNLLQSKNNQFLFEKQRYEQSINKLKAQIEQLVKQNQRVKQIQAQLSNVQPQIQQLQISIKYLNERQSTKSKQLEEETNRLRRCLAESQRKNINLTKQIECLQAQLQQGLGQSYKQHNTLQMLKQQLQVNKKQYLIIYSHLQSEQLNNTKLKQINLKLNQKSSQLATYNMKLKQDLIKSQLTCRQLKQQMDQVEKKNNKNLQLKIEDYKTQLEIAKQQKQMIEQDMKNQLESRKKMIEALIKEKKMLYVCMD